MYPPSLRLCAYAPGVKIAWGYDRISTIVTRRLGTCREWVGGSLALVKLERGGRTHLSRSSQPGLGYAPLPGEPGRQGEPSWGAHRPPELERRSLRRYMGYLGSKAENSPAAEPAQFQGCGSRCSPRLPRLLLPQLLSAHPEPCSGAGCSGLQQRHRVGASRASAPRPPPSLLLPPRSALA